MTHPAATTTFTYEPYFNAIGQVTHVVNPAGKVTKNVYDTAGRLKKTYDGLGQNVEFVFNTAGQMTAHKDQKGNTTTYT